MDEVIHNRVKYDFGGWISVEKRLPDEGEKVIVCQDGKKVCPIAVTYNNTRNFNKGWWTIKIYESFPLENITHWQPLPEPPK
jgi:hypothetical protein